jgi:hypothetical protein
MFNPFKKKKEDDVLDLTQKPEPAQPDIPIPAEMRERLKAQTKEIQETDDSKNSSAEEPKKEENTGGFFGGFFGGGGYRKNR